MPVCVWNCPFSATQSCSKQGSKSWFNQADFRFYCAISETLTASLFIRKVSFRMMMKTAKRETKPSRILVSLSPEKSPTHHQDTAVVLLWCLSHGMSFELKFWWAKTLIQMKYVQLNRVSLKPLYKRISDRVLKVLNRNFQFRARMVLSLSTVIKPAQSQRIIKSEKAFSICRPSCSRKTIRSFDWAFYLLKFSNLNWWAL